MRYPASEKLEIIRLVEQSPLPVRHFFDQASRASVQPSGHLAITTRRLQRPPTPDGCLVADLRYVVAGWSPIVGL